MYYETPYNYFHSERPFSQGDILVKDKDRFVNHKINVWVSDKTQQGAYEKFSIAYMSGNTSKF